MSDGEGATAAQGNTEGAAQQTPSTSTVPPVMADPPEEKPAGQKEPEGEAKPEGDGKPEESEAKPDYFEGVKLPEGMKLDAEITPKAAELFGKYKLPREAAQEFVDLAVSMQRRGAEAVSTAQTETLRKMAAEITSRPNFAKEKPLVRLGIDNLAKDNPRIRELYNDPVFGNMPELWEIALAVGKRFETEGQLLNGGKDPGNGKSFLSQMYPSMSQNKENKQ